MTRLAKLREREAALLREIESAEQWYIRCGTKREAAALSRLEARLAKLRENIALLLPPVEYEMHGDRPYLVLRHTRGRTAQCPFCGECHSHGPYDGCVVAHCCVSGATVTAPDGTVLHQTHGYVLRAAAVPA